ncbi:hypothetical protein CIPAW_16G058600 [Carya illinoinensis]|uniref:NB-ARC domain-containing protein n=1 Tax=Carya illinoinensis TaxID=32201 RepID=A0A8T1N4T7_CARIL|nr:hypothetical protein CIPAW_16G058600 [Carya illinoinensis]
MCLNGWCPNLKLRYSLGKKAQKNTQVIDELLQKGKDYARVYNIKTPLKVRSPSTELFKDFESRKSTIQNVLNALKNDDINMIALWGMAGVGKTKMAKEIKRIVESDNLFHKVAITVVSQNPNFIKIQGELAESLGTRLQAEFLHGRANELYSILTETKKVLLILDDVWKPLDIEDIGVYQAIKEKSCKILLTTRNEETCNGKSIRPKIFPVELLSEEEAWNLFKEMVGDYINASDLISIAEQVAKECARLPLAIAVVGSALRNKSDKNEWKAVLQQLKMSMLENIFDLQAKVYSSIGFSYNYLESNEAKSCFLLCCLYPEDYDVPVEHLVRYGVAKRFFNGLDTVEETRVHVCAIVQNLRRSNLLLDGNKAECVKMHDVVRDVVISIASKEENGFMVNLDKGLKDWPPMDRSYDSYTAISLLLREMKGHPIELKCPKLQLLRLSCLNHSKTFPYNFFNGMKELKMLSMQEGCFSLTLLPPSIQIFQNLQMLNLQSCRLGDVSAIGTLGNLEILGFPNSDIEELQSEIGNLSRLKLLDMKGCDSLKRIAAGVLSGLSRLEELYVGRFRNWACKTTMEGNGEGINILLLSYWPSRTSRNLLPASIAKLLVQLQVVKISNCNLMENVIQKEYEAGEEMRAYILSSEAHSLKWPSIKNIKLFGCPNLKTFGSEVKSGRKERKMDAELDPRGQEPSAGSSSARESLGLFNRWIESCVPRCRNYSPSQGNSSSSLGENKNDLINKKITLTKQEKQNVSETENQTKISSLFPHNLIESLESLQIFFIGKCDSLEVIFELEGLNAEESNIFNNLTSLSLEYLPKLLHIWKKGPREIKGFNYLRHLEVSKCHSLKCLFTPSIAKLLVKLEEIKVYECNEMEEILAKESEDEDNRDVIAFPLVKTLWLWDLQKLQCFYIEDNHDFEWPSMGEIFISECPKLKMFVSTSTKTPKLGGVRMGYKVFQPMVGDLNATIQHIIKQKVCYNL